MAICADCDRTVEIDSHGRCKKCGSSSIVVPQVSRLLGDTSSEGIIRPQDIINEANRVIDKFSDEQATFVNTLALQLIVARNTLLAGDRFGAYMERVVHMWALARDIQDGEQSNENPDKSQGN